MSSIRNFVHFLPIHLKVFAFIVFSKIIASFAQWFVKVAMPRDFTQSDPLFVKYSGCSSRVDTLGKLKASRIQTRFGEISESIESQ